MCLGRYAGPATAFVSKAEDEDELRGFMTIIPISYADHFIRIGAYEKAETSAVGAAEDELEEGGGGKLAKFANPVKANVVVVEEATWKGANESSWLLLMLLVVV
ncbi:hypothetical protein HK102_004740 [Quaeritorhiza haematococci]|nr:hypothetical protein HK102_004740 [Quaeritorhiza haematococci]